MTCESLSHQFLGAAIVCRLAHVRVESLMFGPLHDFYKELYENFEGWFDAFAERARADEEEVEEFYFDTDHRVKGDQKADIATVLETLQAAVKDARTEEKDTTTQAMHDEALRDIEKFMWQLRSMK